MKAATRLTGTALLTALTAWSPQTFAKGHASKARGLGTDANAIVAFGEHQLRGVTRQAQLLLLVHRHDADHQLRVRSWSIADKNTLLEITNPNREERIASLWEAGGSGHLWNYLPQADQVVRAPHAALRHPWMGTHFTYEEMTQAGSLSRDYTHRLVRRDKVGDDAVVVIECVAKTKAASWAKVRYWARTSDWLPVKEEFFDETGGLVRMLRYGRYGRADGRALPGLVIAKSGEVPDEWTVMIVQKVLFDRALNPSLFTQTRLRTNARQNRIWLQGWSESRLNVSEAGVEKRVLASRR